MSNRYSRLFSPPANLYMDGSPVLITAGALLKDNYNNRILVQLKFRNISTKTIKSVNVKVHAYDTAKGQLTGVETFSYLDLSAVANEEFGQQTPIYLSDTSTRSFSVEILSVVYADGEVYTPNTASLVMEAPKSLLEEVQRVKDKKAKQERISNKRYARAMVFGFISVASVILSIILYAVIDHRTFGEEISKYFYRYMFALLIPGLCLLVARTGKQHAAMRKIILIICIVLSTLKFATIVLCFIAYGPNSNCELFLLANHLWGSVIGAETGVYLREIFYGKANQIDVIYIVACFFAVLPNILCTTGLAICNKRIK